ncbi:hypothetical protein SAMN06264855_103254 [Halorubrum vacuolatum]|uniref:Uncharacterized protein n=1 Tax=Halorubrum vacuolatum TaxID=63740 RepID=A0A238VQ39_HALVU|nr:hypothetical protein SAMN06264855_103254 [Halorubrum vacuolatum]
MIQKVWEVGRGIVAVILIVGILYAIFDWRYTHGIYGFGDPILGMIESTAPDVFAILAVASIFAVFVFYNRFSSSWQR